MTIFFFDQTFDGLLTAVFDAYLYRCFPDDLLTEGIPQPLFADRVHHVITDEEKSQRVWRGLGKKLSPSALSCLAQAWLAEEDETPVTLFRYMRKAIDAPRSIETDFGDADVLALLRMWRRVAGERQRLLQFIRFQKTSDGVYFAAVEPEKNALPLVIDHFRDRFADQRWLIYDIARAYGYYYDLHDVRQVSFSENDRQSGALATGRLTDEQLDADELLFQQLWRTYFQAICIRERLNPRKQRNDMPVRYWKYLTEKQK